MDTPEQPRVSVVIAAYKGAQTIGQQLDALAHQVDAPPFEVIVVDKTPPTIFGTCASVTDLC